MISLRNICLWRGEKEVFRNLTLSFHLGQRIGTFGRNGAGKSTLFGLLTGEFMPDEGDLSIPRTWQLAYMRQDTAPVKTTALDWVLDGDSALRKLESAIEEAENKHDNQRLALLLSDMEDIDGYTAPARAAEILNGLGFSAAEFDLPYEQFSGGWRIRLNLAQTLMCRSDLLLLDEPTNHLDLETTLWLESWLMRYSGTLLVISHDRDFLNVISTHIAHVHHMDIRLYQGNFETFERIRGEQLQSEAAAFSRQQSQIQHLQQFIDRFRAKATKAKQVQSRLKALDRMKLTAPAYTDSPYQFTFPNPAKLTNELLRIKGGQLGYADAVILEKVDLDIFPGSRIGVLGANGTGKSTLIKVLADELSLLDGEIHRGTHYRVESGEIGYFAQHQIEQLDNRIAPLQLLKQSSEQASAQQIRNYLGGWGFPGEMATRPCGELSGGERARLVLSLIAWRKPTLLLLDEPTNHLDLDMRQALAIALQDYEGALVLVTHDRHLMGQVIDEFLITAMGKLRPYQSDLEHYTGELKKQKLGQRAQTTATKKEKRKVSAQLRNRSKQLRDTVKNLERQIERLSAQFDRCTSQLENPALYEAAESPDAENQSSKLIQLTSEQSQLRKKIAAFENEWFEAEEQLQKLSRSSNLATD